MMTPDEFVGRMRGLVISLWGYLSAEECSRVEHLIDHDEHGEALIALSWIIVNGAKQVPAAAIDLIEEFAEGLVDQEDMAPELRTHALPRPQSG